ncbi:hypothetical protein AAFN60_02715 [Roseibacillus persicicus]|uniref:hypothetical protein n=1 Tax=Roseibacillus persicicus TaxID=454148 RepID=UPI00398B8927
MKLPSLFASTLILFESVHASEHLWQDPYVGSEPGVLYLPDSNAVYWRYGWSREAGDQKGIRITGQFPSTRYFSYNIYNDQTKTSLGAIADFELVADDEATNPFKAGVKTEGQSYTLTVLPKGTPTKDKNVLYFPDDLTEVSIFLRHYVPEEGIEGGVALPSISVLDPSQTEPIEAAPSNEIPALSKAEAQKYLIPLFKKWALSFEENPEAVLAQLHKRDRTQPLNLKEIIAKQVVSKAFTHFRPGKTVESFNFQTSGTYPNRDNAYLTMPVVRNEGEVLAVKFLAPKGASQPSDFGGAEVRYFSLCQGDEETYTHGTVMDTEMEVSENGYIYFLIGDNEEAVMSKAKEWGVNFMPWEAGDQALFVFRHMLPSKTFENGFNRVPVFTYDLSAEEQSASKTIGNFAPRGKLLSKDELLKAEQFPAFE